MSERALEERFFAQIERSPDDPENGCWEWEGHRSRDGYGFFRPIKGGPQAYTHRWSWEFFNGPIPEGLVIDHLCRNRACANPRHLDPVTQAENLRRGEMGAALARHHAARTRCKKGLHDWTPANKRKASIGYICGPCRDEWDANYKAKKELVS